MTKRLLKPMLTLGVASVLAFAAASTSFAQTQQRNSGTHQCWIPTNDDMGVGYWGDCSAKGARPTK